MRDLLWLVVPIGIIIALFVLLIVWCNIALGNFQTNCGVIGGTVHQYDDVFICEDVNKDVIGVYDY